MVAADSLEVMHLKNTPPPGSVDYAHIFRRRILTNAHYWRNFVAERADDVTALDGEREGILKALAFALDLQGEAWAWVYDLIVSFSPYMERRGHWESWNELLDRAIRVAGQVEERADTVTLSILFARLWQRQSRPRETISHYRRAIHLARRIEDEFSEARACSNLGFLYTEGGQWWRAEILCCHALAIFERLNSDHGRAHTENHLGLLYAWQGLWDRAKPHLERAHALWQAMSDNHGLMRGFINLGMLYNELEHPNEALAFLEKAIPQAELTGEEAEIGKIYINMGIAYKLKGELDQAERYNRLAEIIFRRFLNSHELAKVWENLGVIYLEQHRLSEAISYFEANLQAWRSLDNKYGEIQTMVHFIEYELLRGNLKHASNWLQEVEYQLKQHDQAKRYRQLYWQVNKFRHSLTE